MCKTTLTAKQDYYLNFKTMFHRENDKEDAVVLNLSLKIKYFWWENRIFFNKQCIS